MKGNLRMIWAMILNLNVILLKSSCSIYINAGLAAVSLNLRYTVVQERNGYVIEARHAWLSTNAVVAVWQKLV
jgi:hypothetical protein